MGTTEFIRISEFCSSHGIEESFVLLLQEYEIINIELQDEERLLHEGELPKLEKMLRMHQELEINPPGLQAIYHLLTKVNELQEQVSTLHRKLNRFENS